MSEIKGTTFMHWLISYFLLWICLSSVFQNLAQAGGFQISEQSVTGLGRAFAGSGVVGEDNSDMFYNPASLSLYDIKQLNLGSYYLTGSGRFKNTGSTQSFITPAGISVINSTGNETTGGRDIFIPNIYYSTPINNKTTFGIGLTTPFAVRTDYGNSWVGRYHSITTQLVNIDLNPNLSYQFNNHFSAGLGLRLLYSEAKLTQAFFTGLNTPDVLSKIDGEDTDIGFNLGLMADFNKFRLGVGYRSKVNLDLDGNFSTGLPGQNTKSSIELSLPETIYLSGKLKLSDQFELLSNFRWTNWDQFDELRIGFNGALPDSISETFWQDSGTLSLGANWYYNDDLTLRAGLARDKTPVSDDPALNTSLFPGSDRDWLTLGLSYQLSSRTRFDIGYAYIFTDDINTDSSTNLLATPDIATDNLVGEIIDGDIQILGFQLNINL